MFVEIVSLFTQNGKLTVTSSIVRSFGVFHMCVAASNHFYVLCIRLHAQVFINIKNVIYSNSLLGVPNLKIKFRQDVCRGKNIFLHPNIV